MSTTPVHTPADASPDGPTAPPDSRNRAQRLLAELVKFGAVGGLAFVVDVGLFNLVLHLTDKPLTSKVVSVVVATTVSYFANRHWTFRDRARSGLRREYVMFFVLNGVGLAISLACLAFTHYALGLRSSLADNLSANVVGLVLATAFRFWSYRRFVFLDEPDHHDPVGTADAVAAASVIATPVQDARQS